MDRIDIHIETQAVKVEELQNAEIGEPSTSIRSRVEDCRNLQNKGIMILEFTTTIMQQFHKSNGQSLWGGNQEKALIRKAMNQLSLSARAYNKILKCPVQLLILIDQLILKKNIYWRQSNFEVWMKHIIIILYCVFIYKKLKTFNTLLWT